MNTNVLLRMSAACCIGLIGSIGAVMIVPKLAIATPISSSPMPMPNSAEARPEIAVLDFDFTPTSIPNDVFINTNPTQGISDLLTNQLVQNRAYSVIERDRISEVLGEEALDHSGLVDSATAAQLGHLLGVRYIVVGSITEYDIQSTHHGFEAAGLFGNSSTHYNATVQITARLVDTNTGQIVDVSQGTGAAQSSDGGTCVLGICGSHSTVSPDALISQAANDAVTQIATRFTQDASSLAH